MPLPALAAGPILKVIGGFIAKNWKAVVILVILAVIGWKVWSIWDENKDLKTEVTELTTKNKELTDDNKQMGDILETSKDAAQKINDLAERLDKDFENLGGRLTKQEETFNRKLDQIRRQPAPKTNEESVNEIVRNAAELRSDDK